MRNSKRVVDAGSPLPIILPGEITSIQEICQARGWDWACEASSFSLIPLLREIETCPVC